MTAPGPTVRVVGRGRAGGSFVRALSRAGWDVVGVLGRDDEIARAAVSVDLVVIAVPDAAVAPVASVIEPDPAGQAVVVHVTGSLGLDALALHPHRASVHPLMTLPTPDVGATRLHGAWFAVAGNDDRSLHMARRLVADLEGHAIVVDDADRVAYHAAATIASNHLVALLGQVERVAAPSGVPLEAYLALVRATVDNVGELGPAGALTGPAARGDWDTLRRHLAVLDAAERPAYLALAAQAARLAGHDLPADLGE